MTSKSSQEINTVQPQAESSEGSTSRTRGKRKQRRKRRLLPDERVEEPRKRSSDSSDLCDEPDLPFGGLQFSSKEDSRAPVRQKRKSEEEPEEFSKRSRNFPSPSESHQNAALACFPGIPGPSPLAKTRHHKRGKFKVKYRQQHALLGKGSFGKVYKGYRKCDKMPVAIKHIPQRFVKRSETNLNPGNKGIPLEVELMLRLKPADGASSATVALLDWYDQHEELILVLERPVPCMNLRKYLYRRECLLPEEEVKIIVRQLVDAVIEVHKKGVFHRDIKDSNILIETGSDVPRIRLIDFGSATFLTEEKYSGMIGNYLYCTPESFERGWCTAELATVWQLGVVVFKLLHGYCPFENEWEITSSVIPMRLRFSLLCKDFIERCLCKEPEDRPNLETLKQHTWLMTPVSDTNAEPSWWKRRLDESLEGARKNSMSKLHPCKDHSHACALVDTSFQERKGSTSRTRGKKKKQRRKRKSLLDKRVEKLRKRSRESPGPCHEPAPTCGGLRPSPKQDFRTPVRQKRKSKGKKNAALACFPGIPGPLKVAKTCRRKRCKFKVKYRQQHALLGNGSFGKVYKGYRKRDKMPVAIKRIPQRFVKRSEMNLNPGNKGIPLEVELMLRLKPADGASSATVALLDWYDQHEELILVLERPVPCMDLRKYLISRGSLLHEEEVKIIIRQLVDAVIEVHKKGVFHRDIKDSNILIETGSDVPRVQLIDFGSATFLTEEKYSGRIGTFIYRTPESFERGWCTAELATVWQLGVVVFKLLHGYHPFENEWEITSSVIPMRLRFSLLCKDFIERCLCKEPEDRPNLKTLKQHAWLM